MFLRVVLLMSLALIAVGCGAGPSTTSTPEPEVSPYLGLSHEEIEAELGDPHLRVAVSPQVAREYWLYLDGPPVDGTPTVTVYFDAEGQVSEVVRSNLVP